MDGELQRILYPANVSDVIGEMVAFLERREIYSINGMARANWIELQSCLYWNGTTIRRIKDYLMKNMPNQLVQLLRPMFLTNDDVAQMRNFLTEREIYAIEGMGRTSWAELRSSPHFNSIILPHMRNRLRRDHPDVYAAMG